MIHKATISSPALPPVAFSERIHILNRDPHRAKEVPEIHINYGAMLILALGNPLHFRFKVFGSEQDFSFKISQKEKEVAQARLYRDPLRGGGYLYPGVESDFRNLGLGILTYIIASRLAYLMWNETLHSNTQQLSPSAQGVWNALIEQRLAFQRGHNDFSFHQRAVESEAFAGLLDVVLKTQTRAEMYAESPHFALPPIKPHAIRKNLSGRLKPYEYWLNTHKT